MSDAINSFCEKCLDGIILNKQRIKQNLEDSLMLVTALNPKIGYSKSSEVAKKAYNENISLKEAVIQLGYLSEKEFEKIINPKKMV